jgi:hypothetical protein
MTALYPSTSAAQVFVPLPLIYTIAVAAPTTIGIAEFLSLGAFYTLLVRDPTGTAIINQSLNGALPAGATYTLQANGATLTLAATLFTSAGLYTVVLLGSGGDTTPVYASFQWGGWIDDMLALVAESAADASMAKSVLINRCDIDDPAAPTELTLYATDGVTPLATRTIANADGSPVNPAQILVLGALTP